MHEFTHEIMKIKTKGRVWWSYWPCERKTLQKFGWKTRKNLQWSLAKLERERKVWKKFWKSVLNLSKRCLKKTWFTMFDWSKNRFDQSNQVEAHWIFLKWFRLIEDQIGLIEILETQPFRKNNLIFENLPQSIEYKK